MQTIEGGVFNLAAEDLPRQPETRRALSSIRFASRSEAAFAVLAEKYIEGWRCRNGDTFQVPIGFGKTVDFRVADVLVEYHPIIIRHEFEDSRAAGQFFRALRHADKWTKEHIWQAIEAEFKMRYYRKRRWALDQHPELKRAELIVAGSPAEVFDQVISRFGTAAHLPNKEGFVKEWSRLINSFKRIR